MPYFKPIFLHKQDYDGTLYYMNETTLGKEVMQRINEKYPAIGRLNYKRVCEPHNVTIKDGYRFSCLKSVNKDLKKWTPRALEICRFLFWGIVLRTLITIWLRLLCLESLRSWECLVEIVSSSFLVCQRKFSLPTIRRLWYCPSWSVWRGGWEL